MCVLLVVRAMRMHNGFKDFSNRRVKQKIFMHTTRDHIGLALGQDSSFILWIQYAR